MPTQTAVISEPLASCANDWLQSRARVIQTPAGDRKALYEQLAKASALIVRTYTIVDQELLDHAPMLRVIARAGVGLDNINLNACAERGIPVVHTPMANTRAVVEYVTQMMLANLRSITRVQSPATSQQWHTIREQAITPRTCVGARLGIIGFGNIGSALAKVAEALGMEVVYTDLIEIEEQMRSNARPVAIDELIRTSDVISVHVDARPSNADMLDSAFFSRLRPDCIVINSARGFIVDEHAASVFAKANPDARLIFDVHSPEPIADDSPLTGLPNVIRTPHIAAGTKSAKEQMSWVVRDVVRVLAGEPPEFLAKLMNA